MREGWIFRGRSVRYHAALEAGARAWGFTEYTVQHRGSVVTVLEQAGLRWVE